MLFQSKDFRDFWAKMQQNEQGWQRLLYIKQDYPDNYTDSSFLQHMEKNVNVRRIEYGTVVLETVSVSLHISSILIFVAVFMQLYSGQLSSRILLGSSVLITVVLYSVWLFMLHPRKSAVSFSRKSSA